MPKCWYDKERDRICFRIFANSIEEFVLTPETAKDLNEELSKAIAERGVIVPGWNI
jgi:hypothetical protein